MNLREIGPDLDRADVSRLAQGDPSALDDLVSRHAPRLLAFLRRLLPNPADAEDLAQEVFLRLYQNAHRFDPHRPFAPWLLTIASNLVRDRLRWLARHPESPLDPFPQDEAPPPDHPQSTSSTDSPSAPDLETLRHERIDAVRAAVQSLPDDLRLILVLAEYEERSHLEIGTILGCTPKAVEMRLYRARAALRLRLARWLDT